MLRKGAFSSGLKKWLDISMQIAGAAVRRFGDENCLRMAASLSYTSLLAVVPLSAIAFAMLAAFPVFEGVREQFNSALFSNFLPQAADSMREYFDRFVRNTAGLSAVGIIGLALTAVLLLGTVESALNTIFRVNRSRRIGPRLLVFWAVITLGPLLLGASFSISTYVFAATAFLGLDVNGTFFGTVAQYLPTILMAAVLTMFYVTIPNRKVSLRAALVGAVTASVMISVLRKVFGMYVASFPTYQNIYGALSAIPIFLIWMYLSWAVVLWGAALAATTCEWRSTRGRLGGRKTSPRSRLTAAMAVLAELTAQTRTGGAVPYSRLSYAAAAGEEVLGQVMTALRNGAFVEQTEAGEWILARDLSHVTLHDLYKVLGLGIEEEETSVSAADDGWRGRLGAQLDALRVRNAETMAVPLHQLIFEPPSGEGDAAGSGGETEQTGSVQRLR